MTVKVTVRVAVDKKFERTFSGVRGLKFTGYRAYADGDIDEQQLVLDLWGAEESFVGDFDFEVTTNGEI